MAIKDVLEFRPTWRERFSDSLSLAKGLSHFDTIHYTIRGYPHCYICGRKKDFIFDFVPLIRHFDMSLNNKLVYICTDHGRITDYDCTTGEPIELPLPKPYWQRRIRDTAYRFILGTVIPIRFVWFFLYDVFMWYIAVWFYYWYQQNTQRGRD